MLRIGVHVSIAGGISKAFERAKRLGCDTFQIFPGSPRMWSKGPSEKEVGLFAAKRRENTGLFPIAIHSIYLVNLASPSEELRRRSVRAVSSDLELARSIGAELVVVHPGSGVTSRREGLRNLLRSLEELLPYVGDVWLLLENTSGQGRTIGGDIEELVGVIESLGSPHGLGICFDTCHAFAFGIDIGSRTRLDELASSISRVGCERLKLVHLNDTRSTFSSKVDIHQHIGLGSIGLHRFRVFLSHELFSQVPMILETPKKGDEDDLRNMRVVRELVRGLDLKEF